MKRVPYFRPSITDLDVEEVTSCLRSGWLTTGARVLAFEQAFAACVGAKYAVAVNSCTAALHLGLEALGVRPGDMVLVPTLTFAATAEAVLYCGAVPVFVDCDPNTMCMDMDAARRCLDDLVAQRPTAGLLPPYGRIGAMIPMHYGGQMADVDAARSLARDYHCAMVEDAAHALPAAIRSHRTSPWRQVGTTADVTCFSFYANKCITTGEGGMATTDSLDVAQHMRLMALHGIAQEVCTHDRPTTKWRYNVVQQGYKYNMTDMAAALGLSQLARVDAMASSRQQIAQYYLRTLANLKSIQLPSEHTNRRHSWHLFALRLRTEHWSIDRDRFMAEMEAMGIGVSMHWKPLHLHPYYRGRYGYGPGLFPVAEHIGRCQVSLPIFPDMTADDMDAVVAAIRFLARTYAGDQP